jgi:hypothetical protein
MLGLFGSGGKIWIRWWLPELCICRNY